MFFSNAALAATLLFSTEVLGGVLVPIRPTGGSSGKRQAPDDLKLKDAETFLWGEKGMTKFCDRIVRALTALIDGSEVASLTVDMPGDCEGILSMEHFDGMLTSITCSDDSISMTFRDDETFAFAQRKWDWVNGADNHSFVMVAGPGDCGDNTDRIPFTITTLSFDEEANVAQLAASRNEWQDIAHTFELVVGAVAQIPENDQTPARRDIDKSISVNFNHDLPFSLSLDRDEFSASLACANCSTAGQFDIEYRVSRKSFIPVGASMKVSPRGVSAIALMKLSGSGTLTESLSQTFDIVSIPLNAITIPGILELGPFFTVTVGASLSALTLTGSITSGAIARLSDDAVLEVNLLKPKKNQFSGWKPQVELIDISADASLSTTVNAFLQPSLSIKAQALGQGFDIGLNMKVPNVNAQFTAIACKCTCTSFFCITIANIVTANTGACPAPAPQTIFGLKIDASIGASLNVAATMKGASDPLFSLELAGLDYPIADVCLPLGKPFARRQIGHPHVRPAVVKA